MRNIFDPADEDAFDITPQLSMNDLTVPEIPRRAVRGPRRNSPPGRCTAEMSRRVLVRRNTGSARNKEVMP